MVVTLEPFSYLFVRLSCLTADIVGIVKSLGVYLNFVTRVTKIGFYLIIF